MPRLVSGTIVGGLALSRQTMVLWLCEGRESAHHRLDVRVLSDITILASAVDEGLAEGREVLLVKLLQRENLLLLLGAALRHLVLKNPLGGNSE